MGYGGHSVNLNILPIVVVFAGSSVRSVSEQAFQLQCGGSRFHDWLFVGQL